MKLGFSGDIAVSVFRDAESAERYSLYRQCRELSDLVDIAIGNFEGIVTPDGLPSDRKMSITESACGAIDQLGFNVFSIANNHSMDCGEAGLGSTMKFLQDAGISVFGAGENREAADACLFLSSQRKKVALLAATDATHNQAGQKRAGVSPLNNRDILRRVARARKLADLVVVSIHSDLEFSNRPAPWKVRLSRQLVRAGADIVVHHHPHTLQGVEFYNDGLIAYSLGNFIFPVHGSEYMKNRDGYVDEGVFLVVNIDWDENDVKKISYDVVPVIIDSENHTSVATGDERQAILDKLEQYGNYLRDTRTLRRAYFDACRRETKMLLLGTYYAMQKEGLKKAISNLVFHTRTRMHRNWMRGLLTLGYR